jgi:hypothetical protein
VLPAKDRVTTRSRLATWLLRRHDGVSCHQWPAMDGALGARQSAEWSRACAAVMGMRPRRALTWRQQPQGGGTRPRCSGGNGRRGAAKLGLGSALLQKWRKGMGRYGSNVWRGGLSHGAARGLWALTGDTGPRAVAMGGQCEAGD